MFVDLCNMQPIALAGAAVLYIENISFQKKKEFEKIQMDWLGSTFCNKKKKALIILIRARAFELQCFSRKLQHPLIEDYFLCSYGPMRSLYRY